MFLLLACAAPCPDGASLADDGRCYATEADTAAPLGVDALTGVGPCTPRAGNGRLDPESACADGACLGESYARFVAALGEEGDEYGATYPEGPLVFVLYRWSVGLYAGFPGLPDDTAQFGYRADPDAPSTWPIWFDETYTGTTSDGVGVDSALGCWIDALGEPALRLEWVAGSPRVTLAWWRELGVQVYPDYAGTDDSTVIFRMPR